jgi:hypothetical protein
MAQKFVSPGVTTNEIDQSFLPVAPTGPVAAIVGRFPKGPAFKPVLLRDWTEHQVKFGEQTPTMQPTYAAKNYLRDANAALAVRVLGHEDGGNASNGYVLGGVLGISDKSGSISVTGSILAVVHHSGTLAVATVAGISGDANRFVFRLTAGATTTFAVTASFLTSSDDYLGKVLNTDPTKYSTYGHYLSEVFPYQAPAASGSWHAVGLSSASWRSFERDYSGGSTPWIKSQRMGGVEYDLFRLHTLADGRATNDDIKVEIANVKPSSSPANNPYGTFDVYVRSFYDNDRTPRIVESFSQLTLDPTSANYILRRIGDVKEEFSTAERKFVVTQGTYPVKSSHIRVELNPDSNAPPQALPWGFRGFSKMQFSGSSTVGANIVPSIPYVVNMKDGNGSFDERIRWGVQFVSGGIVDRMRAFPDMAAGEAWMTGSDTDFSLQHLSGAYDNGKLRYWYNPAQTGYSPIFASSSLQRFVLPFQGGFDGWDLRVRDPLYLANDADETNIGVASLLRALDTVAEPDQVDIENLAVPGVHNIRVTDRARAIANGRKDVFYIMDITGSTVREAIDGLRARDIDDNYTATYYPDVRIDDQVNHVNVRVAPSAVILGVLAYGDRNGQAFFAPAGFTRGLLKRMGVVDAVDRLNTPDREALYDNRINPIATFPAEGIVVHGQKTLQLAASALDRINVRRLLIKAKKQVVAAAKEILFEQNNPESYQRFKNRVNPILERIRQDQGISRFAVIMDSSTTTGADIDRGIVRGKIFLEPVRSAEFIDIDFVITATGVTFAS